MSNQFRPGWQLPPGAWPYSIQDLLQTAPSPSGLRTEPGLQKSALSARPPTGGLLAILGEQNARRDASASGLLGAVLPPASGGYFGSTAPPAAGWGSSAPHWLQTAMPFGADLGLPPSWSDPSPQMSPLAWDAPTLPNLQMPSLADVDAGGLYWPQTVLPAGADGSGLPFSTPPANAPPDAPPQQAPLAMWDSAIPPIPPVLPPVFPPSPPKEGPNEGSSSSLRVLANSYAELPAARDLASVAAPDILAAQLNSGAPDDWRHVYDAMTCRVAATARYDRRGEPDGAFGALADVARPADR